MAKKSALAVKDVQPFRYPGGKSKLVTNPAFLALLYPLAQSGGVFYEGFIGSGAVSLAVAIQFPEKKIVVADKGPTISGFWELVASGTDGEAAELERLVLAFPEIQGGPLGTEGEDQYCAKVRYFRQLRTNPPATLVERAFHALFFNRTCFSGIAMSQPIGGYYQRSKWTIDCRFNAPLLVEKVRNLRTLLRGRMTVSDADIWDWLPGIPKNAPMYLDAPYYVKGKALYPVAMKDFEHERLAAVLGARTNWIISYDICKPIEKLYENQKMLEIPFRYSINGSKDVWNYQQEYLICSPEINTEAFESELVKWHADVEARTKEAKERSAKKKAAAAAPEAV